MDFWGEKSALREAVRKGEDIELFGVRYSPLSRSCFECGHLERTGECDFLHVGPASGYCSMFQWRSEALRLDDDGVALTSDGLARANGWQCYRNGAFTWFRDRCPISDTKECPLFMKEDRPCKMSADDEAVVSDAYARWALERWGESDGS